MESWLKIIVGYLAGGAEIAAVVIGGAVLRGIINYIKLIFSRSRQHFDATEPRTFQNLCTI